MLARSGVAVCCRFVPRENVHAKCDTPNGHCTFVALSSARASLLCIHSVGVGKRGHAGKLARAQRHSGSQEVAAQGRQKGGLQKETG